MKVNLLRLKENILNSFKPNNRNYEYEYDLENQCEYKNKDIYRLVYLFFDRENEKDITMWVDNDFCDYLSLDTFMFPIGMNQFDGFFVISFIKKYIDDKCNNLTLKDKIILLNDILSIPELKFNKVECDDKDKINDLCLCYGRVNILKNNKYSEYYNRYFYWLMNYSCMEDAIKRYEKIGIKLDINIIDDYINRNKGKVLEKVK